jgi:Tfp pilus assembly protein PilF
VQTDDERVDEDLSVAKFYLNDENYQGAYLRAKDAVNIQPEYSAAHFVLAEIAQKMKKKDEAIAEFQTYLKLDPDGEKAKAAKKALADLQ